MAEERPYGVCNERFVSKRSARFMTKILIPIMTLVLGASLTWAWSTQASVSSLTTDMAAVKNEIDRLNRQINDKLDILIARSDEKERKSKHK